MLTITIDTNTCKHYMLIALTSATTWVLLSMAIAMLLDVPFGAALSLALAALTCFITLIFGISTLIMACINPLSGLDTSSDVLFKYFFLVLYTPCYIATLWVISNLYTGDDILLIWSSLIICTLADYMVASIIKLVIDAVKYCLTRYYVKPITVVIVQQPLVPMTTV